MEVISDLVEYFVLFFASWIIWATKRIYAIDKEAALNKQNDNQVSLALSEFKKSIEALTTSVNELNIKFAEKFGKT